MARSSPTPRTIIHVDLDAFYCAVEEQHDPTLHGVAFAVGGRADERGVVASCSYAARRYGVRSAMAMGAAQRLCPNLLVVPARHGLYRAVSRQVMELLRRFTSQLEQLSIDEAFLDATELVANSSKTGHELALEIQRQVRDELGLSCSIGVASNKMVAKIATDYGKTAKRTKLSPQAVWVVEMGREAEFLAPLPVSALWGVGPKLEARLKEMDIETIGALARWDERDLARRFGRHGVDLAQHARGIDKREVVTERERKSLSSETTFLHDVEEWETLYTTLQEQAESVAAQLRKEKLQATTVKLKIRWSDFTYSTRQSTLPSSTDAAPIFAEAATQLLKQLWQDATPIRLLGVGVSGLSLVRQLGLFDEPESTEVEAVPIEEKSGASDGRRQRNEKRRQKFQETVTLLEARFGSAVVHLGARHEG